MAPPFDARLYIHNSGIGSLRWGPIRCHPFFLLLDRLVLLLDLFRLLYPYHSFYLLSPLFKFFHSLLHFF
jgi:hypothetical protein